MRYEAEKKDLVKLIETKGKEIHFSEIDVSKGDFKEMLQEMSIKSADLVQYPVTVVIDNGHGVWVHGPREFSKIKQILEQFESNPESIEY